VWLVGDDRRVYIHQRQASVLLTPAQLHISKWGFDITVYVANDK